MPKRIANRLTSWQSVRAFAQSFEAFRIASFNESFSPELFFFTRDEREMGNYIQIRKLFRKREKKKLIQLWNIIADEYHATRSIQPSNIDPGSSTQAQDKNACQICFDARRDTIFTCGHGGCGRCLARLTNCHICRARVTDRILLRF